MDVVEVQGVCKDMEAQRNVRIPQCITNDLALGDGKGMGSEGLIRFLRAKVKVLQDEVSKLQADYKKRTEEWHQQHSEIKNVEEDRNKWHQQAVATKEQLCKQEQQCTIMNRKLQQREMENVALRKIHCFTDKFWMRRGSNPGCVARNSEH
uniref:Uncharacterized protein n=1 Tax=Timema tahoe TaxID=61484 RepID=A0A7R9IHB0_9NEOP|nr:unnamed protein product [Timema tahoe]